MKHPSRTAVPILALSLLLTACQDDAENTDTADASNPSPADVPVTETLANPLIDSSSLDAQMKAFLAANPVAGLSVAIVNARDEPLVWSGHYGVRNIESAAPVNDRTSFWLGSTSKLVMGTAMMIARERGFLNLDDNVQALLTADGTFSIDNPSLRPITLAQLASHASGIVDAHTYLCAYYWLDDDGKPTNELIDPEGDALIDVACPDQDPGNVSLDGYLAAYLDKDGELYDIEANYSQAVPGAEEEYSNIGAGLAGHVIGLSTGQDLATFAAQEIFTPLAMQRTSWRSGDLEPDNIATPYSELNGELFALPAYELATWPDGGLRSNATDLATLLSALLQDRRSDGSMSNLLSADSIEAMLPVGDAEYGLFVEGDITLRYADKTRRVWGHTGSDPGAFSALLFDPEADIGVVLAGNGDDEGFDETSFEQLLTALFESANALRAVSR